MARYDYRCSACDKVFEVSHGMREHPDVTCPDCGAPCSRVFDASGIVFKGSGFYNTDMRGSKGSTEGTSGSPKPADSAPAASKETTSKPADKPAAASAPAAAKKD